MTVPPAPPGRLRAPPRPLPAPIGQAPAPERSVPSVARLFARLRWRLLRGTIRHGGASAFAVVAGLIGSVIVGLGGTAVIVTVARTADDPATFVTLVPVALALATIALGVITGVTQAIDPRVIAAEPLRDRTLAFGLLVASAFGPAGIATTLLGIGMVVGVVDRPGAIVPGAVALAAFLTTMLLVSRTTVNVLALFVIRFPRSGQLLVGLVSLVFYGTVQFVPQAFARLDPDGRRTVAHVARFTPPGQVGAAFATAGSAPLASLGHALVGALWLPLLAWIFSVSTRRVLLATPGSRRSRRGTRSRPLGIGPIVRRACGPGPVGAIAWRSVRTRMRHPRTALETFVGAGIGMAVVLVPALTRDQVGASAVLVGGAVQLSVLFMAGNSIGTDGPALGSEILCGLEPETVIAGKMRGVVVVASPLAAVGPLIAASVSGEWSYLPAGVAVGIAGLLAGVGGAIVQSTLVPIAVSESDNPLASGNSGSSLLSVLVLVAVVIALGVCTIPFALLIVVALSTGSVVLVTVAAFVTIGGGWMSMRLGSGIATRRWRTHEPELYDAIIPAR